MPLCQKMKLSQLFFWVWVCASCDCAIFFLIYFQYMPFITDVLKPDITLKIYSDVFHIDMDEAEKRLLPDIDKRVVSGDYPLKNLTHSEAMQVSLCR